MTHIHPISGLRAPSFAARTPSAMVRLLVRSTPVLMLPSVILVNRLATANASFLRPFSSSSVKTGTNAP